MSALLYSGGLDAYCIRLLEEPDTLVVVDPGTPEAAQERELIEETVDDYERVDMPFLEEHEQHDKIIPFRNTFFAMAGAFYDEKVMLGATAGDGVDTDDTTRSWASSVEAALNAYSGTYVDYEVSLPFKEYTKAGLVRETVVMTNKSYSDMLSETKSCHHGTIDKGCGNCLGCLRRFVAFASNGFAGEVLLSHFEKNPVEDFYKRKQQELVNNFYKRGQEYNNFLVALDNYEPMIDIPSPSPGVSKT